MQAIGWALYEDVVWKDGKILNARMTNYVIPTSKDAPPFDTILVEHPFSGGPNGAKGVGELPMDGGAPAIAAAIEQAIGVACDDLPLLPGEALRGVRRAARVGAAEAAQVIRLTVNGRTPRGGGASARAPARRAPVRSGSPERRKGAAKGSAARAPCCSTAYR